VELQYAVMPSFIAATYRKEGGEVFVVMQESIKDTLKEQAALIKIEKGRAEGIITN
jgi:hypothetical protein